VSFDVALRRSHDLSWPRFKQRMVAALAAKRMSPHRQVWESKQHLTLSAAAERRHTDLADGSKSCVAASRLGALECYSRSHVLRRGLTRGAAPQLTAASTWLKRKESATSKSVSEGLSEFLVTRFHPRLEPGNPWQMLAASKKSLAHALALRVLMSATCNPLARGPKMMTVACCACHEGVPPCPV
jgi:hypothetical protein